jgi:hypothetical protein
MNESGTANDQYETTDASGWPNRSVVSPTGEKLTVMAQGWYCPRCHRVNNPMLMHCDCDDNMPYATALEVAPPTFSLTVDAGAGSNICVEMDDYLKRYADDEER